MAKEKTDLDKILKETNEFFKKLQNGTVRCRTVVINHSEHHFSVKNIREELIDGKWVEVDE